MLIAVHGFWSDIFKLDSITILLFFILAIPYIAQYLRKAKLPGAEFEFKENIAKLQKLIELGYEQTKIQKIDKEKIPEVESRLSKEFKNIEEVKAYHLYLLIYLLRKRC
jgi:hypothetical protein